MRAFVVPPADMHADLFGWHIGERVVEGLDMALGDFDEVLADEQREISTVGRNTEGYGGGAGGEDSVTPALVLLIFLTVAFSAHSREYPEVYEGQHPRLYIDQARVDKVPINATAAVVADDRRKDIGPESQVTA